MHFKLSKNASPDNILSGLFPTEMAVTKKILLPSVALGLFHERAGCCMILSTPAL